jgi:hypothetical protein
MFPAQGTLHLGTLEVLQCYYLRTSINGRKAQKCKEKGKKKKNLILTRR